MLDVALNPIESGKKFIEEVDKIGDKIGKKLNDIAIPIGEKMNEGLAARLQEQVKLGSNANVAIAMAKAFNEEVKKGWKNYESERTRQAKREARAAADELVKRKQELEDRRHATPEGPMKPGDMGTPAWWGMTQAMIASVAAGPGEPSPKPRGGMGDIQPGVVGFADLNRQIQMAMLKDKTAEHQRGQIVDATRVTAEAAKDIAKNTKKPPDGGGLAGGPAT